MALLMSMILQRIGYKNGMVLGLLVMVIGALIFIPAAMWRMYSIFLLALFVLGTGLTTLQTASNIFGLVAIPRWISQQTALTGSAVLGLIFAIVLINADGGSHTSTVSALLIMGIAGGAILPVVYGALAEASNNPQGSYWIMLPC